MSTFLAAICILTGVNAYCYGHYGSENDDSPEGSSGVFATQQRRAAERFDIISWIRSNEARVAAQNSRYGYTGGSRIRSDVVLTYTQDSGNVTRDSSTVGKDTRVGGRIQYLLDNLFTEGDRTRSMNIDLGVEGFTSQTTAFSSDPAANQLAHTFNETGGGLLIRPLGRSSQDSGLLLKGGYMNMTETGLWSNTTNQVSLYGTYLGAEAKIYLLPFLGIRGEYEATLPQSNDALKAQWNMTRFTYGAFLEIYLLDFGAYLMNTEMDLSPNNGGATVKEAYSGFGLTGTVYF